jgi:hypothetical protein
MVFEHIAKPNSNHVLGIKKSTLNIPAKPRLNLRISTNIQIWWYTSKKGNP